MAVSFLRRLAAAGPVPVLPLYGPPGRARARALTLTDGVELAASPREAALVLAVGPMDAALRDFARAVHDQLPAPRARVAWGEPGPWPDARSIEDDEDPVPELQAIFRELVERGEGDPVFGPLENPVEWRGVGPHGQGGKGMMGGNPYGRPMAMTGPDPTDGLALDRVPVTVGPFFMGLPPHLRLELELQGDVVASLVTRAFPSEVSDLDPIFHRAGTEPVAIAELELARARHLLEACADLLGFQGLRGAARRLLRLARDPLGAGPTEIRRARRLRRALWLGLHGVGRLEGPGATRGPNARAAGLEADARLADPAYAALGFAPVVLEGGDALARFEARVEEAARAVELAIAAQDRLRAPGPGVEGPRGPLVGDDGRDLRRALEDAAVGQPWDALVTTLVSLDLEPWTWADERRPGSADDEAESAA